MKTTTHNLIILLENTSHPGNIGAAARAMKNMGCSSLRLIQPKAFPHTEATNRAKNAQDILEQATCYDTLEDAIQDLDLLFATSARTRSTPHTTYTPESLAEHLATQQPGKIGLLFGNEQSGLSNASLKYCQGIIHIPANDAYAILNLAQAVQIITYVLARDQHPPSPNGHQGATLGEQEAFFKHLETRLDQTPFFNHQNKEHTLQRLRCALQRANLSSKEISLINGTYHAFINAHTPKEKHHDNA
jgi:TrmH family RNA methyltransferase